MRTDEHKEKRRTCFMVMIIIVFFVILMAGVYFQKTVYENKKLDVWTGQYIFSDAFGHKHI